MDVSFYQYKNSKEIKTDRLAGSTSVKSPTNESILPNFLPNVCFGKSEGCSCLSLERPQNGDSNAGPIANTTTASSCLATEWKTSPWIKTLGQLKEIVVRNRLGGIFTRETDTIRPNSSYMRFDLAMTRVD